MIAKIVTASALLLIFLIFCGDVVVGAALADSIDDFAAAEGLVHRPEFDRTVAALRHRGGLPRDLYVGKAEARRRGWHPGADLCPWLAGRMIGGDRFDDREGALPPDRTYREADLDEEDCGRRGAKRLVFDDRGDIWVTIDHYRSFQAVP